MYRFLILVILLSASCAPEKNNSSQIQNFLLEELPAAVTGIDFRNILKEDVDHNIINYIYYYNGAGVAAGDINNDGLIDLYFASNMGANKLYLNKGNFNFEDITHSAKINSNSDWNTGVSMIDINSDGYLDIYVCSVSGLLDFKGHNELFINNGDNTFTEKSAEYGLDFKGYSTQAYFFDFDKDNDLDVYIVNHAIHTTLSHGKADVRNKRVPLVGDVLLKNENGSFKDVSEEAGIYGGVNGYGLSATIADFNNDGWDDLYVCNDFHEDDYFYLNNQDGTFSERLADYFSITSRFSMGSDAGDLNNDGFQDLLTLDMLPFNEKVIKQTEGDAAMLNMNDKLKDLGYKDQYARNMLQINNQAKHFTEIALIENMEATDWSWAPLIADYNLDGRQDIFIANGILRRPNDLDFKKYVSSAFKNRTPENGTKWLYNSINEMPDGKVPNMIYMGDKDGFSPKSGEWLSGEATLSNGAIYADLDNDGDLDIVLNNLNSDASVLKNNTENKHWLSFKLEYSKGNKEGIGTKVTVYTKDFIQFKQLFKSRGFLSSVDSRLTFGLNNKNTVDSIEIIWPDNSLQRIKNLLVDTLIQVNYQHGLAKYSYPEKQKGFFKESDLISYFHQEDSYNDFYNEKLIPLKTSNLGPAVCTGDVDNNGFEDIFIGNASGKPGKLLMNSGNGFSELNIKNIKADSLFEDNAATFIDVDSDGDLDLYVGSGIPENQRIALQLDRLYINENGNFTKSKTIPENNLITKSVIAADYDQDGDQDLFIGNLATVNDYGRPVESFILKNDGYGNFTKDENFRIKTHLTDAKWEDLNQDGFPELLITAEWDSPTIAWNRNGKFQLQDFNDDLNGLWQAIDVFDVDEDGDQDIVLGNWGLNTRYKVQKGKGIRMYYSDFNDDGISETLIAYQINDDYYPISSKDELASQLNYINKVFTSYKDFSLRTVNQISSEKAISKSQIYEIKELASGYLENKNGKFKNFHTFSKELQLGPITNFEHSKIEGENSLIISGNSFRVNSYHGGYSSMKGMLMNNLEDCRSLSELGLPALNNQVRKIISLPMRESSLCIILNNNSPIEVYSWTEVKR